MLIARYTEPQVVGLALVVLALVIFVAWLVRRRVAVLQRLYIPTAVIGGFAMLLLGPQVLGALTGTRGPSTASRASRSTCSSWRPSARCLSPRSAPTSPPSSCSR
ncbi:MAG: hypothetical protein GX593_14275 [Actinomycetales bacterium]|nr:hypothetical protein [Actinomycetales bacterium]